MKYIFLFTFILYSCCVIAQQNDVNTKVNTENINIEKVEEVVSDEEIAKEEIAEVKLPFEFTKATSQKFNGGAPGAGSTIMLSIFLKKLTNENLVFTKIWISKDKPAYQLKLKRKNMADKWSNYHVDDELILFATSRNNNPKPDVENAESSILPPYEFTGDALIEYSFNNELMYYELPKLDKLQDINAQ